MHRRVLGAAVGLAVAAATGVPIGLPALSGPYPVGTTDLHLVDRARKDPWKPAQQREVMATVTYPASRTGAGPRAPWLETGMIALIDELVSSPYYFDVPRGSVDCRWCCSRRATAARAS